MASLGLDRRLAFEGCFNFRDLGGYRAENGRTVRWRRLFRSDALQYMSPSDVEFSRRELGIATIFDLRMEDEITRDGLGPLVADPVRYFHRPVLVGVREPSEEAEDPVERYFEFLQEGAPYIANLLQILSTDVFPAVFHCAAGKDRTGIVAALVLGLLGVEDETIVADYALSNEAVPRVIERLRASSGYWEAVGDLPVENFMVKSETMQGFLERLRSTYGSAHGFAQSHGVEPETVRRIQGLLLE